MELPKRIMIVEDEVITQRYLKNIFDQYEIDTTACFDNAKDALSAMKTNTYDMILMDINIKGSVDGIQLAREILRSHTLPIVFITAHSDNETFQEVLDLSPYGFISKPFSGKDVEVAVQLAYRRFISYAKSHHEEQKAPATQQIMLTPEYMYATSEGKLYHNNVLVKLNMKQNKLLQVLSRNINHVVTYDRITDEIWGDEFISDSALRTLVYTVRKVLPDLPIVSHSKVGYSLNIEMPN